jgi:hypothetical protein
MSASLQKVLNSCTAVKRREGPSNRHSRARVAVKTNGRSQWASDAPLDALFVQATTACAFRFLRHPNRPNAPRPVAKSGNAAGSGVCETVQIPGSSST